MLPDFIDAVKTVLGSDAGLTAWVLDNFNKRFEQLDSYRDINAINPDEYPLQLFRVGDGRAEIKTANYIEHNPELIIEFLWVENDYDRSLSQVKALPDLVAIAMLRDAALNNYGAYMDEWRIGDPALHPVQTIGFRIIGNYALTV